MFEIFETYFFVHRVVALVLEVQSTKVPRAVHASAEVQTRNCCDLRSPKSIEPG